MALLSETSRLYEFCQRYFSSAGARRFPAPEQVLCVELPREIDKELTDRPFYWMWVEAMRENPPNTILYLKFAPDAQECDAPAAAKPELITRGCYRLMRIIASAKHRGALAAGYENAPRVTPFALFSIKISYVCDVRQDFLETYAIDLRDFHIYPNAMKYVERLALADERPKGAQIAPIPCDVEQLFSLVIEHARQDIEKRDHTWAVEAQRRLAEELRRLDAYYNSLEEENCNERDTSIDLRSFSGPATLQNGRPSPEATDSGSTTAFSRAAEWELRRAEITWRMEPKIEIRPTQFALLYLSRPPCDK